MDRVTILDWDSTFFGFKVASINPPFLHKEDIKQLCTKLRNESVKICYWKTPNVINEFPEKIDVTLVDVASIYSIKLPTETTKNDTHISLYQDKVASEELIKIGIQCGLYSRFKVDSKFPSGSFEKMYSQWIQKSVKKELADDIILYEKDSKLAGIVTVYVKNKIGHIGLFGIDESMRGKGIGKKLLNASLNYFKDKKCESAQVVTQSENVAGCAAYESVGFSLKQKQYCYHIWL